MQKHQVHQPNEQNMLRLIGHGSVGAVLIVGHGCEVIQAGKLAAYAARIHKPVRVVMDQQIGRWI